ncbi:hypothetical protein EB061_05270 [bacterium]|jgi:hypothetical protein|nr:hypothetical protein [bacterium]
MLFLLMIPARLAMAEALPEEGFRTPAKRYGAAYSIKVDLVKDGLHYVIPVWIKPDQMESTLDPGQMRFTGWATKGNTADQVILSGYSVGERKFKLARSDWAVKPEYPKNCCMGVIGQDLLSHFRLRFDPGPPAHIHWTWIEPVNPAHRGAARGFQDQLRLLFTTRSEIIEVKGARYNMGSTPFLLDVSAQKLVFEPAGQARVEGLRSSPLFSYEFIGFSRDVGVISIDAPGAQKAGRMGFVPGAMVKELDGVPVSGMTRAEIDSYLRGRKGRELRIGFEKKSATGEKSTLIFDFQKNEFTPSRSIPRPAGRN